MPSDQDDYPNLTSPQAGVLAPDNPITGDVQQPVLPARVELFDIDLTPIDSGAGVLRFTTNVGASAVVTWRGNDYTPAQVYSAGWEVSSRGTLPRPRVGIRAFTAGLVAGSLLTYGNFEGAIVTRWLTYADYLDGEAGADPEAYFPPAVFRVERLSARDSSYVEWELCALMDFEGKKIPRIQLLRDICTYTYRYHNGTSFDYTKAECPYSGTSYFNRMGVAVSAANDDCGRLISDCRLRYPGKVDLPARMFKGLARSRIA